MAKVTLLLPKSKPMLFFEDAPLDLKLCIPGLQSLFHFFQKKKPKTIHLENCLLFLGTRSKTLPSSHSSPFPLPSQTISGSGLSTVHSSVLAVFSPSSSSCSLHTFLQALLLT